MATYSNLSTGSRGDEVKKLQQKLIEKGYSVGAAGADGIYGADTDAAVRKYQQENGLNVDGIAGSQTQSKLYSSQTAAAPAVTPTTQPAGNTQQATGGAQTKPDYSRYSYDPSANDAYMKALEALQAAQKELPTYAGTYDAQLNEIYNKILGREKFSYDMNSDPMWQMYRDQYLQQGQMAMMDTMGQAAGLTGGYGSSYAQSVGQQAYNAYLQDLNAQVPALYGAALDAYTAEGDAMAQQFAMIGDLRNDEYGRYQDALDRYWQNVDYLKGSADDAYDQGYEDWMNSYQMAQDAYDRLADQILMSGQIPGTEELAAAGMTSAEAQRYRQAYLDGLAVGGSGGGGGGSYSSGGGDETGAYEDAGGLSLAEVRANVLDLAQRGSTTAAKEAVRDAQKSGFITASEASTLMAQVASAAKGTSGTTTAKSTDKTNTNKSAAVKGASSSSTYNSYLQTLKTAKRNGATAASLEKTLNQLVSSGRITSSERKSMAKALGLY